MGFNRNIWLVASGILLALVAEQAYGQIPLTKIGYPGKTCSSRCMKSCSETCATVYQTQTRCERDCPRRCHRRCFVLRGASFQDSLRHFIQ
uniref:Uncharacterized protein n=1 Tax=Rhipicephalus appendiculatus TaxID=34631 RepID=A0A131YDM4_RHIAP